jgi:hypothetical protein
MKRLHGEPAPPVLGDDTLITFGAQHRHDPATWWASSLCPLALTAATRPGPMRIWLITEFGLCIKLLAGPPQSHGLCQ